VSTTSTTTRARVLRRTATALAAAALLLTASCSSDDDATTEEAVELSPAAQEGLRVAETNGCTSCHSTGGRDGVGPSWIGLAGSEVELDDGSVVVADEEYLRRSIVEPNAQIVEGYRGIMPERSLDPAELDAIVAYLQEIGAG
jgi:cytochrome c oxidase subunit 2